MYAHMSMYTIILHFKVTQQPTVFQNSLEFHWTKWHAVNILRFLVIFSFEQQKNLSQLIEFSPSDHQKSWLSLYLHNSFIDVHKENVGSK